MWVMMWGGGRHTPGILVGPTFSLVALTFLLFVDVMFVIIKMFKFKFVYTNFQAAIRRVLSVLILKPVTPESCIDALGEVKLKET